LFDDIHNPRLSSLVGTETPAAQDTPDDESGEDDASEYASEAGARVVAMATDHVAVRVAHPNRKSLPILTPLGVSRKFSS
jgi:hypothetical protein